MRRTSIDVPPAGGRADGYRLDDQVGHLLRRAYQVASANLASRLERYRLTPMQFAVLARLRERAPLSQNLLGRLVAMEPANIRDVVVRLKRRGLVRTGRDGADRRLILVTLSTAGAALADKLLPLSRASTAATLRPLSAREATLLRGFLQRIAAAEGSAPRA